MGMVFTNGQIKVPTKEIGITTKFVGTESTLGMTKEHIRVTGLTTICMDRVFINGLMAVNTKVIT